MSDTGSQFTDCLQSFLVEQHFMIAAQLFLSLNPRCDVLSDYQDAGSTIQFESGPRIDAVHRIALARIKHLWIFSDSSLSNFERTNPSNKLLASFGRRQIRAHFA